MPDLSVLLDVARPAADASSDHPSLVVGLMLAADFFLWLASYLPARDGRHR